MIRMLSGFLVLAFLFTLYVVAGEGDPNNVSDLSMKDSQAKVTQKIVSSVNTKEIQQKTTPQEVVDDLMAGNKRYVAGNLTARDLPAQIEATTSGQSPKAIILSCVDSRVPVEKVFDQGVGDVFVARVAGNAENEDILGSVEYAMGVAGSKVLVVLGHESCGAIKSAIDKLDVGSANVDALLGQLEPAVAAVEGERNSKDKGYVASVIKQNVKQTMADVRSRSSIISGLESSGKAKIVGAYYSLKDGSVTLVE